jgi:hypothetical protein
MMQSKSKSGFSAIMDITVPSVEEEALFHCDTVFLYGEAGRFSCFARKNGVL